MKTLSKIIRNAMMNKNIFDVVCDNDSFNYNKDNIEEMIKTMVDKKIINNFKSLHVHNDFSVDIIGNIKWDFNKHNTKNIFNDYISNNIVINKLTGDVLVRGKNIVKYLPKIITNVLYIDDVKDLKNLKYCSCRSCRDLLIYRCPLFHDTSTLPVVLNDFDIDDEASQMPVSKVRSMININRYNKKTNNPY